MADVTNTSLVKRILYKCIPSAMLESYRFQREYYAWKGRGYTSPSPARIKRAVLLREGLKDATWIETGTYLGETTALLSKNAKHVHTIEVVPGLAERAKDLFKDVDNITVWQGDSGVALAEVLPKLEGNVNFWLDGHFSGAFTGKGEGECETPIIAELKIIDKAIESANKVNFMVIVDDVRCFGADPAYPALDFLAHWGEKNAKEWHIEHDIFVAHIVK